MMLAPKYENNGRKWAQQQLECLLEILVYNIHAWNYCYFCWIFLMVEHTTDILFYEFVFFFMQITKIHFRWNIHFSTFSSSHLKWTDSFKIIAAKIYNTFNFKTFISLLKSLYNCHNHFHGQIWVLSIFFICLSNIFHR